MTTIAHSQSFGFAAIAQRAGSALSAFRTALSDYAAYRRTRDELSGLSDRELDDLGLNRHDIERISREAAYNR